MKFRLVTGRFSAILIGTTLLAACATGASGIAPSGVHPAWWREAPPAARVGVYVAQANGAADGIVFEFGTQNRKNKAPSCSIGNQKFVDTDIAADPAGNLYLANVQSGAVNVYGPNCGNLVASFIDPYGSDGDVALHGSTIYAVGSQHVAVCTRKGCSGELTDPSILQLETAAVDSKGNVWGSFYNQQGRISLIVWQNGAMPGHSVSGYVNQNTPGGLIFDKHDNLVSIQTRFFHAYAYRCDAAAASCTNTGTFTLHAASLFGAFNARNTDIQVTDYANDSVDVYAYPEFTYEYSYDNGLIKTSSVQGIAQTR
ncbi:MAG TPA: hypothetical protein VMT95_02900 [Candidatus Binatia bacterium]|nr:hypothetical protein [Candidatus Binatia bacterium]